MTFIRSITPILNICHIGESFEWFEILGWKRSFSWNANGMIGRNDAAHAKNEHGDATFAAVISGDATIFLCKDSQGAKSTIAPRFAGDEQTGGVWMSW